MLENVAIFPSELRPSRIGNSGSFHVSHQEDSKFKGFLFAVFYRTIWRREDKRFFSPVSNAVVQGEQFFHQMEWMTFVGPPRRGGWTF